MPCEEFSGESGLPDGEYVGWSRLPRGYYIEEYSQIFALRNDSSVIGTRRSFAVPLVNTPGSCNSPMVNTHYQLQK
jgi:hypothetical protein